DVGPGLPGGEDLGRREGPGHHQLVVTLAQADDVEVDRGGDEILRTGEKGRPGRLRIEDRTRSQQHAVAQGAADGADDVERIGHGHGDLDDGDAVLGEGAADLDELLAVGGAHDGDDATVEDTAEVGFFAHAGYCAARAEARPARGRRRCRPVVQVEGGTKNSWRGGVG